jgi:hypothetical protein
MNKNSGWPYPELDRKFSVPLEPMIVPLTKVEKVFYVVIMLCVMVLAGMVGVFVYDLAFPTPADVPVILEHYTP